mgnify:FL=1
MKNYEVQPLLEGLTTLKDVKLPGKVAYAVLRNIDKLSSCFKTIEDSRKKFAEEACEKDAEGKPSLEEVDGNQVYKLKEGNDFHKQYGELLDSEADIELFKIDENLLDSVELTLEQTNYLFQISK